MEKSSLLLNHMTYHWSNSQTHDEERKSQRSNLCRSMKLGQYLIVCTCIQRTRACPGQISRLDHPLRLKPTTYTHNELNDTTNTINHLRNVPRFLGFRGSASPPSHLTTKSNSGSTSTEFSMPFSGLSS